MRNIQQRRHQVVNRGCCCYGIGMGGALKSSPPRRRRLGLDGIAVLRKSTIIIADK